MGLLQKIQDEFKRPKYFSQSEFHDLENMSTPLLRELSRDDVWRYRRIRGVNLGSWFVLEPWMVKKPFRSAKEPKLSDLDVAKGKNALDVLTEHWDNYMNDSDWIWLEEHGINAVRIPIGYYHLAGQEPRVIIGTDFDGYGAAFAGAWKYILKAIETAGRHGMGVLIDLHAAAGGQNRDSHSGTSTGKVGFWDSQANLESTSIALQFLVRNLAPIKHCLGLELLNEPVNNDLLQDWYERRMACLRHIDPHLPIYISDAWDLNWYSQLVGKRPDFVVVDHHLYRCFTSDDQRHSGDELAAALKNETSKHLSAMSKNARGNIVIGEWSAALHPDSLRSAEPGEQDRQRRVFAMAQLDCFEEFTAGSFFWTYKKERGWDAGWSMRDAVQAEILPPYFGRKRPLRPLAHDPKTKGESLAKALARHQDYWNANGGTYEFWRFEEGYSRGWDDATMFVTFPHGGSMSVLGMQGEWIKQRLACHARDKGASSFLWEYEHGFNEGHDAAMAAYN